MPIGEPAEPEPDNAGVGKVRRAWPNSLLLCYGLEEDMKTTLSFAVALLGSVAAHAQDKPELIVYTYDSFVSDWGPGPGVEAAFEENCGCDLKLIAVGDGAGILSRLKLEGGRTDADVVLGLDTNLTADAAASGLIAPHGITGAFDMPIAWDDPNFLPYDWGYFAFVYDETKVADVPSSFEELITSDLEIVIQDPRSSTPGLGLLMWVEAAYGADAARIWEGLSPKIATVTKGWDEAYGMFLEGEVDMVLSYTTSPSYHIIAEEDLSKKAAAFDEGHYMQVEVAGMVEGSDQPELAKSFLEFMISDGFQSIIPTTNWMYPVVQPEGGLPDAFAKPVADDKALLIPANEASGIRDAALAEWIRVLSK